MYNPARDATASLKLLHQGNVVVLLRYTEKERTIFPCREGAAPLYHHRIDAKCRHCPGECATDAIVVCEDQPAAACGDVERTQVGRQFSASFPGWEVEEVG